MSVFVDTSALFAVLDADDQFHQRARAVWTNFLERGEDLITTSYVLIETFALVQHRLGMEAVRTLEEDILSVVHVQWVMKPIIELVSSHCFPRIAVSSAWWTA